MEGLLDLYGVRLYPEVKRRLNLMREAIGPTANNASGATYEKWVSRLAGGRDSHIDSLAPEKKRSYQDVDHLAEGIAWQRWNIVEGPKESIRVDDPGSDGFSRADPDNIMRYMAIEQLHNALTDVEKDYRARKAQFASHDYMMDVWSVKLKGPGQNAQFLIGKPPVMFDHRMWRVMHWGGHRLTKNLSGKLYYQIRTLRSDD